RDVLASPAFDGALPDLALLRQEDLTYQWNPLYTPDGDGLVFLRHAQNDLAQEIYLSDLTGETFHRLTTNTRTDWQPTWRTFR
ncbi:MAG: hypothetical protein AAF125_12310, partial [Chloroflexota bacterium]